MVTTGRTVFLLNQLTTVLQFKSTCTRRGFTASAGGMVKSSGLSLSGIQQVADGSVTVNNLNFKTVERKTVTCSPELNNWPRANTCHGKYGTRSH